MCSAKFHSNLDEVLKEINRKVEKLNGQVSFDKLFTPSFMTRYTQFSSFSELLDAGGFKVESQEDFEALPEEEFNELLCKTTKFKTWEEMKSKAGLEYVERGLKL